MFVRNLALFLAFLQLTNVISTGEITCDEKTCQNGKCIEENGKTSCSCLQGFTGSLCENEIDPCQINPCKNEGLCIKDSANKHSCICLPGFIGENCEEQDPCSFTPCKNNGTCRSVKTGSETLYTCLCEAEFYGQNCENENPCAKDPCKNYGLCKFDFETKKSSCLCLKGFTGEFCDQKDPCSSNPCQNGGVCKVADSSSEISFTCSCPVTHYGLFCESENPCSSSPCKNNGLCKFEVTDLKVSCLCMDNFNGEFCDEACEDNTKLCKLASGIKLCSTLGSQCKKSCGLCGK